MLPKNVKINEVGARDGLQNEKVNISIRRKNRIYKSFKFMRYKYIEVGSFVSPKWIPQMKNSNVVYNKIKKNKKINYPLLVPNMNWFKKCIRK